MNSARAGRHPYPGFQFPHVLGAEHAGVIAALGPATSFPLEAAADAHQYLEDGQNVGRVSLVVPQPERSQP